MKRVKITDFKTKRINKLTGGQIKDFKIPDYPNDEGLLTDSFLSLKGEYIGNYEDAWWFVKNNMVVCFEYPHGVAIRLNSFKPKIKLKNAIKDKFESWFCEQWENDNLIGYYSYTHRGGQTFKIGDRFFDENYEPISDVIPFAKRGKKLISNWDEAKQAAINMSKYLS